MSLPEFPTISPALTREDAINQIISSIAMEELALSHIMNAEGEKLQYILGTLPGSTGPQPTIDQVLEVNNSVRSVLEGAAEVQTALRSKLQSALSASTMQGATGPTGPTGPTGAGAGINAYAGIYAEDESLIAQVVPNVPYIVELPRQSSALNATYDVENSITVLQAGTYYISYAMRPNANSGSNVKLALRANGVDIPYTVENHFLTGNRQFDYYGGIIIDLAANAVIDMTVTSDIAQNISFYEEIKNLNIIRLS